MTTTLAACDSCFGRWSIIRTERIYIVHEMRYKGYDIVESSRHGKACKGFKKTTSIQVRQPLHDGYLLKKQISYPITDAVKRSDAIDKAMRFVDELCK